MEVNINSDLGESSKFHSTENDPALLKIVNSANIACGYHAGDEETMEKTIRISKDNGVSIGSHPSYLDRENFGRKRMNISPEEVTKLVIDQCEILNKVADKLKMKGDPQHNRTIVNGIPRIGHMKGGQAARWIDEDMADDFLKEAQTYITTNKDKPFFLYYGLQQPHVPRTPHPRFVGATGMGPRGDVIAEADWCVGELIKTLKKEGILENTLIFLSSDNGPVLDDGYEDDAIEKLGKHTPTGNLRGGKYSLFEAGTRVPFITYWKGKIKPQVTDAMVSQIDFLNSIASLIGSEIRSKDGMDLSDVLFKNSGEGRNELVLEAQTKTAFRNKNWVLIPPYKGAAKSFYTNVELGNDANYQLFDLHTDRSQQNNLAESHPEKLNEMIERYQEIRGSQ